MLIPRPGDVMADRYRVLQILRQYPGRVTLLALDATNQQQVVVKLFSLAEAPSWQDWKLFEREMTILQQLNHPGIPRYVDGFDWGEGQQKVLVQTYIPALCLRQWLAQGRRFSEAEIISIAEQVLEILIYLHGQQPPLIHRDLKPSNILLDGEGKVYVVDFGAVQAKPLSGEGTMTLTIPGTAGYIAPEQFRGRTVPASDLYSLGATLVALASGRDPDTLPEKELRLQFEPYVSLSLPVVGWLQRLLDPRLEYRFASAQEALAALRQREQGMITLPPAGIQLRSFPQGTQLCLPPQGRGRGVLFMSLFAVAWFSFLIFWTGTALVLAPGLLKLVFVAFSLPFWGAGWLLISQGILPSLGRHSLVVTGDAIDLVQEVLGFRIHRPGPSPRHQLRRLEVRPSVQPGGLDLLAGDNLLYEIKIIGSEHTYLLESLQESQARWCAQYLSQTLGIPMRVAYPYAPLQL